MENAWLAHHGIPNQKWGVRRFQNPDGTLTEAGKKRYRGNTEPKRPAGAKIDGPNGNTNSKHGKIDGITKDNKNHKVEGGEPKHMSIFERHAQKKQEKRDRKEAEKQAKIDAKQAKIDAKEAKKQHKQEIKEINKEAKARDKEWDEQRTRMSDKDLDAVLSRKRKEQELHKMTHEGSTFTKTVMTDVGKKVLTTVIAGAALYGAKVFCDSILGNEDLGNAVYPGGAKKKKEKEN
jgi:hypothetical protein